MQKYDPEPENALSAPKPARRGVALIVGGIFVVFSVLLSLLIAEAGFRVTTGVPVFDLQNWRLEGVRTKRIGERAVGDETLGWTLKDGFRSEGFNTIDHGVRRNFDETAVRTGAILAVGDSFTEGFDEVTDAHTWPAHLEKITGQPVVNGGVAGYATDQIVLRAEQLLPVIKPKTLIVGFTEVDIYRAALAEAGAPKPYFTVEKDELVYHPPTPLDAKVEESVFGSTARGVLGYSALADYLMSRLTPKFWYPTEASVYKEVENNSLDVTCRLLPRLKRQTDQTNVRLLLFLQYGGELVLEEQETIEDMRVLSECAQRAGIEVVDQFAPLRALTRGNPDLVGQYYTLQGDEFGHMSSKGNEHAAQLLARSLAEDRTPDATVLGTKEALPN